MDALFLGILALFALFTIIGIIVGLFRGGRKAVLRLITLAAAFLLALLFTPLIAQIAVGQSWSFIEGTGALDSLKDIPIASELIESRFDLVSKIALVFVNPILFLVVFLVFWLLSLIVFWIVAAVTKPKKVKDEDGKVIKPKKKRLIGLLCGFASGFIIFFSLFIPINGYLNIAGQLSDLEIDGKPVLSAVEEIELPGGFIIDIAGYNNNPGIKAFGLGLGNPCFDYLSSATVLDNKIVLSKDVATLLEAYSLFEDIDAENMLADIDALRAVVNKALDAGLISAVIDAAIDVGVEKPDLIADYLAESLGGGEEDPFMEILINPEPLKDVLTELQGAVKTQLNSAFDAIKTVNELGIDFATMDIDAISGLTDAQSDALVDALFEVKFVRNLLPYVIPALTEPLADELGVTISSDRPVISESQWDNEKTQIKNIFKSLKVLMDLMDLMNNSEENTDDQIAMLEDLFSRQNAEALGTIMESLRDSRLLGSIYNAATVFDEDKDEYFFISYMNELLFDTTSSGVSTMSADPSDTAKNTLRGLFKQDGAEKVGGVSANDNIDFSKVSWKKIFTGVSDMVGFIVNMKNFEQVSDITEISKETISELLDSLENMDKKMVQTVLETLIPTDSNITIPDLENADLKKEAEIYNKLFDYQEKLTAEEEEISQEEVDDIVASIAGSDVILPMLNSAGSTVSLSDTEKDKVELALANLSDNSKEEEIRKLLGMTR